MKTRSIRIPLLLALCMAVSSCTSTSFMGLSKSSHVDEELARIDQRMQELDEHERRLSEMETVVGDVQELESQMARMNEVRDEITLKLNDIVVNMSVIGSRIDELPETTLRELIAAIEAYISDGVPANPLPPASAAGSTAGG